MSRSRIVLPQLASRSCVFCHNISRGHVVAWFCHYGFRGHVGCVTMSVVVTWTRYFATGCTGHVICTTLNNVVVWFLTISVMVT